MALPKLYEQIVWHNNTTPALNEDNLNSMSQAIDDIDDRVIEIASTVMEDVPVIEEALEALDPPIRVVKDFAGVQALTDALEKNAVDVKVKVTPKQDLHGYSKPWAGGAGKNKFQVTATTSTVQGVTLTVNSDGTIKCSNNTASGLIAKSLGSFTGLASVKFAGCPSGGGSNTYGLQLYDATSGTYGQSDYGSGGSATLNAGHTYQLQLIIRSGVNANGLVFKPMVCLSTESNVDYAHFEPYTNICPITGFTEAKVTRMGKNLFDGTLTNGQINNSGAYSSNNTSVSNADATISNRLKIKAGKYTIGAENLDYCTLLVKDASGDILYNDANAWHSLPYTFTNPSEGYLYFTCRKSDNSNISTTQNIQVQEGSTAVFDGYTANTYTISLGDTRYLAELDVTSGELTVTHGYGTISSVGRLGTNTTGKYRFNSSDTFPLAKAESASSAVNLISNMFVPTSLNNTYACVEGITIHHTNYMAYFYAEGWSGKTADEVNTILASTPIQIVYELATPVTVQLTATEVALLYAYNTLWADTGDLALTYDASGVLRIANSKLDIDTFKSIVASSSDFADFKSKVAAL